MTDEQKNLEDIMSDPEAWAEAQAKAQEGELSVPLFVMWEMTLERHIIGSSNKAGLFYVQNLLQRWPFLDHELIPLYMEDRAARLKQVLEIIHEVIDDQPKHRDALVLENVNDFQLHRRLYLELLMRFTELQEFWQDDWADILFDHPLKKAAHASIADMMDLLLGEHGFGVELRALKGYEWQDEDNEWATERIAELRAERTAQNKLMDDLEREVDSIAEDRDE